MKRDDAEKVRQVARGILEPWLTRVDGIELRIRGDGIVMIRDGKELGFVPGTATLPKQLPPNKVAFPLHYREETILQLALVLAKSNLANAQSGRRGGSKGRGKPKETNKSDEVAKLDQRIDRDLRVNGKVDARTLIDSFEGILARSTVLAHIAARGKGRRKAEK